MRLLLLEWTTRIPLLLLRRRRLDRQCESWVLTTWPGAERSMNLMSFLVCLHCQLQVAFDEVAMDVIRPIGASRMLQISCRRAAVAQAASSRMWWQ